MTCTHCIPCFEGPERIPKILTFVDYYLPGYKAGGPLRAVSNLVEAIGDKVTFRVVTRDRDRDDDKPFSSVTVGKWQRVGKAEVLYLPVESLDASRIETLLDESEYDWIFLNSMFSPVTRQALKVMRRSPKASRRILLAPRGESAASALAQKQMRKSVFLAASRLTGLYEGLTWLSSSSHESEDIQRMWHRLGVKGTLQEIAELPMTIDSSVKSGPPKQPGALNAVFLGRIVPVKNLLGALDFLDSAPGAVNFTICGPKENADYWNMCETRIRSLPSNISVTYAGALPHEQVPELLGRQHLLIAPSFGENYGHSIVEALSLGCPVLISDQTPWRGLEAAGAGWDILLAETVRARAAVAMMVAMNAPAFAAMQSRAREYAMVRTDYAAITRKNVEFFMTPSVT